MSNDKNNLFLTLLKLKSYLASMIDERSDLYNNFNLTNEYLDRRLPGKKSEIISLLEDNGIYSDVEIAFDERIIFKFRAIAEKTKENISLISLLNKLEIEAKDEVIKDEARVNFITEREKRLGEILELLFQLATNWAVLKELEDKVDDYSILDEEEVIRPEEEKNLNALDNTTSRAFNVISDLTKKYIQKLIEYYFTFGGDIALKEFIDELEETRNEVARKYYELFKKSGLDEDWLKKL